MPYSHAQNINDLTYLSTQGGCAVFKMELDLMISLQTLEMYISTHRWHCPSRPLRRDYGLPLLILSLRNYQLWDLGDTE